ncbi:undecaprenyl phosphate translocase family protein [Natranaerobius thermophilus]|uniref:undecaprenyl phosphate translocase family protein n=1 Tax=Natranaerobius thermophilus TaxID=375929 RepID=UPI0039C87212
MYPTYIAALSNLHGMVLLVLGIGKLLGVLAVARLIHFLLKQFYCLTYFAIIGLLLGSVINIWPGISPGPSFLINCFILLGGFLMAYLFQVKPLKYLNRK